MSDDSYSASQLRNLYRRKGGKKDEELTASQLQARYGSPKRKKGWGKKGPQSAIDTPTAMIVAACGVVLVVLYVIFMR